LLIRKLLDCLIFTLWYRSFLNVYDSSYCKSGSRKTFAPVEHTENITSVTAQTWNRVWDPLAREMNISAHMKLWYQPQDVSINYLQSEEGSARQSSKSQGKLKRTWDSQFQSLFFPAITELSILMPVESACPLFWDTEVQVFVYSVCEE
jgi:hypothetical protein